MAIQDLAKLSEASEVFKTYFYAELERMMAQMQPLVSLFSMEVTVNTLVAKHRWMGDLPELREWVGERVIHNLKADGFSVENKDWEATIGVHRNELRYDQLGIVKPRILQLAESAARWPWLQLAEKVNGGFTAGNVSFDGEVFFSSGHATGSNVTDDVLDVDAYFDLKEKMKSQVNSNGIKLNIKPTHFFHASNLEQTAKEIFKAERDAAGATNIAFNDVAMIEIPELTDDYWGIADLSRASMKPFIMQYVPVAEGLDQAGGELVRFVARDNPEFSESVFLRQEYEFGVDRSGAAAYGFHPLIAASDGSGS